MRLSSPGLSVCKVHVSFSSFGVTGKVNVFVIGTVVLSRGLKMLNGLVVDCGVVSVDVFVRGTVMLSSGLNASVVDCVVVSVYVFRAVPKLLQFSQKVAPIFQKSCSKVAPKF